MTSADHDRRLSRSGAPAPAVLHRCGTWHGSESTCPCKLSRTAAPSTTGAVPVPSSVGDVVATPGTGLDADTAARMRARLGHDFSSVRLHADEQAGASARAVGALAYTAGQHVVIDPARMPPPGPARDQVLAHELVHTRQQGDDPDHGVPETTSDPHSDHEREAEEVTAGSGGAAGSAGPAGAEVQRSPLAGAREPDIGLTLSIREDGQLDVSLAGPPFPPIGRPALGVRREPGGDYRLLTGSGDHLLAPGDLPDRLRHMLRFKGPKVPEPQRFDVPACGQLRTADGTRWQTFGEYHLSQIIAPSTLPLSQPFYDELLSRCQAPKTVPAADQAVPPARVAPVPAVVPEVPAPADPAAGAATPATSGAAPVDRPTPATEGERS